MTKINFKQKANNMTIDYDVDTIKMHIEEALNHAYLAATSYHETYGEQAEELNCGFAWIELLQYKGNTKAGKKLKECGIDQNFDGNFSIWNPSGLGTQNVNCLYVGALAAEKYLSDLGYNVKAYSRLD